MKIVDFGLVIIVHFMICVIKRAKRVRAMAKIFNYKSSEPEPVAHKKSTVEHVKQNTMSKSILQVLRLRPLDAVLCATEREIREGYFKTFKLKYYDRENRNIKRRI
jgi:hypothetical protein